MRCSGGGLGVWRASSRTATAPIVAPVTRGSSPVSSARTDAQSADEVRGVVARQIGKGAVLVFAAPRGRQRAGEGPATTLAPAPAHGARDRGAGAQLAAGGAPAAIAEQAEAASWRGRR